MNDSEEIPLSQENWQERTLERQIKHRAKNTDPNPAWELNLGIKWLSRAGIVALLAGFAMALSYSWEHLNHAMSPEIKILIAGMVALGLFISGSKLFERFQLLGRILQGGGMALGYLSLFAMFFIPAVQLFHQPGQQSIGWGLLLLYVGMMIITARKMDSRSVAILSLGFGYYTASYAGSQLISFISSLMLSGASVILGNHKKSWKIIPQIAFAGFLAIYMLWQGQGHLAPSSFLNMLPSHLLGDSGDEKFYLISNFLLFHIASLLPNRKGENFNDESDNLPGFNLLNSLLTYGLFTVTQPGFLFGFQGGVEAFMALTHLVSYGILKGKVSTPIIRTQSNLLLCVLFSLLTVFACLNAWMQPIAIAVGALAFGINQGNPKPENRLFTIISGILLVVSFITLTTFNWAAMPWLMLLTTVGMVCISGLLLGEKTFNRIQDGCGPVMAVFSSFVFLVALMIGLQNYWITLAIVLTGFAFLVAGFICTRPHYRWTGLGWIFLAVCRLLTVDLLLLATPHKIALFMALGVTLLAASLGYNILARKLTAHPPEPDYSNPHSEEV